MGFQQYLIVRNSDLYEYKGLTKAVLMTIAHLVIDEPEEDERGKTKGKPDPDAGWCVAGQDYLAAALGMSPGGVSSAVKIIKQDGWLEVVTWRNRFGHMHNKYRIPAEKLEQIQRRAHKKDELGNFIRSKQPKKARNLQRGEHGEFLTARSRKGSNPEIPRNTGKPRISHASATRETCEAPSAPTEAVGRPYSDPRATVASRQVDKRLDVTEPQGLTASCGEPCGTEPSSAGCSVSCQQVVSAGGEKPSSSRHASLDTFGETEETSSLDPTGASLLDHTQRTSSSGHQTQGDPCEPQGEDFSPSPASLPQPGTLSVPPSGGPPVPPPPAPKLPEAHYSHKWEEYDFNQKRFHNCEFCRCDRTSQSAGRLCRPDSERKEEAHLWRLAQEDRLEAGVGPPSSDTTSLSF